jgi:tocopherol O-methyltransferase
MSVGVDAGELTGRIRAHYDRLSGLYQVLWGRHIHHGLFETGRESRAEAQVALIEALVGLAGIERGSRVLDVGCGLGGSSMHLALEHECECVGITISGVQARRATRAARRAGLAGRVSFGVHDANDMTGIEGPFDVVWCVECSEHIVDKGKLVREWGRLVRAGGRVALAAWCVREGMDAASRARYIEPVERGMLLAGMVSAREYEGMLREAEFGAVRVRDVSEQVRLTWDVCARIARQGWVRALAGAMGDDVRAFVGSFGVMREAFGVGEMRYALRGGVRTDETVIG